MFIPLIAYRLGGGWGSSPDKILLHPNIASIVKFDDKGDDTGKSFRAWVRLDNDRTFMIVFKDPVFEKHYSRWPQTREQDREVGLHLTRHVAALLKKADWCNEEELGAWRNNQKRLEWSCDCILVKYDENEYGYES
jgi:hypothetical protein